MSGRIVREVMDNAPLDLTTAELLVLIALAEDARDNTRHAERCDVESLVYRTRLKPGTVRNALSTLVRRALIHPTMDRVYRGGKHQEYDLTRLYPHHRDTTINGTNVSPPNDMPRHSPMTRSPVDNS